MEMSQNQPSPRFGHSAVTYGEKMYLFGGWDGKSTLNDIWVFEWSTLRWQKISSYSGVAPRYRHTAIAYSNFMVVFGGVDHYHIR
jgi:N-acetylneuraminic acid mutarotase